MQDQANRFLGDQQFFLDGFVGFTGTRPFDWQKRLFKLFLNGAIPQRVALPTGAGKTSLMIIWLLAYVRLNKHAKTHALPRRLVWIVDRRVVVDQATEEALNIRRRILDLDRIDDSGPREALAAAKAELQNICVNPLNEAVPLAVSTLRGEMADNQEWKKDPSKLGIIIGTVDMIGSRLLFSGYGDGAYFRPFHAGLLGVDALIVIDEAHLSPALVKTVQQVEMYSNSQGHAFPSMRMIELTATPRGCSQHVFTLSEDDPDIQDCESPLAVRMMAKKELYIHACDTTPEGKERDQYQALQEKIVSIARNYAQTGQRIAIYVQSPQLAQRIHNELASLENIDKENVGLLTGTIRGYERDQLEKGPIFKAFYGPDNSHGLAREGQTYFMVMTSAGEVGVNLSADHMVCDLVSLESLIQRLGRVLRFGAPGRVARIDLVHTFGKISDRKKYTKKTLERLMRRREWSTLKLLEKRIEDIANRALRGDLLFGSEEYALDVSPWSFIAHPFPESAYSEVPWSPVVDASHLDQWAMTSIPDREMPQRRPVEPWLHGVRDPVPESYLAWRDDVDLIGRSNVDQRQLKTHVSAFKVLAHEKVKCKTDDLISILGLRKNTKSRDSEENGDYLKTHLILQYKDGTVQALNLLVTFKRFGMGYNG